MQYFSLQDWKKGQNVSLIFCSVAEVAGRPFFYIGILTGNMCDICIISMYMWLTTMVNVSAKWKPSPLCDQVSPVSPHGLNTGIAWPLPGRPFCDVSWRRQTVWCMTDLLAHFLALFHGRVSDSSRCCFHLWHKIKMVTRMPQKHKKKKWIFGWSITCFF